MSELGTGGETYNTTVDAFCEKLKLSKRFVTDPYSWLGLKIRLGTNIVNVVDVDYPQGANGFSLTAGYWLVENLDTGEMLNMGINFDEGTLYIIYYLH